jgi:alcohol dehydrogenase/L-iditol 2-dehydrogenase
VQPGEIVLGEIPAPDVGPGEVSIAVAGVGLCGSDLSVFSGKWTTPSSPWVMGHEAFGLIDAIGEGVPGARIGQTVVVEPNLACLTCEQCRRGWTSACTARQSVGMNRPGALADRLVVPAPFAWPISPMDHTDLVCVEPTTVILASLRRLGAAVPQSVMVVGAGAQGLLMTLALIDRGVEVHVFDVNPDRVAFASRLGAHPTATGAAGPSFDLVVDTVGSPASVEVAIGRVSVGGTILLLGLDERPLGLSAQRLVRHQLVVRGSLTYDHPDDFAATVAMLSKGLFRPGRVVSEVYDLADAQMAFERAASAAGKTWIRISNEG